MFAFTERYLMIKSTASVACRLTSFVKLMGCFQLDQNKTTPLGNANKGNGLVEEDVRSESVPDAPKESFSDFILDCLLDKHL